MRLIDDEPTAPINIAELLEDNDEPVTSAKGTRDLPSRKVVLEPNLDLISPTGVRGYIGGRTYDDSGRWVFVILDGDRFEHHHVVDLWPHQLVGFKTKDGRTIE